MSSLKGKGEINDHPSQFQWELACLLYTSTAYGADELIETFKTNALSALDGAKVVLDAPVVENGF